MSGGGGTEGMGFLALGIERSSVAVFGDEASAVAFALRSGGVIVLGDCPQYWVTSPRVASRLVKAGYEYAI